MSGVVKINITESESTLKALLSQPKPAKSLSEKSARHDMKKLAQLLDAVVVERPDAQQLEQHLCLDRGYDYSSCWQEAEERGYIPHIPQKDAPIPVPTAPNCHPPRRWVVEVGHSWNNALPTKSSSVFEKQPQRYARIYSASGLPNFVP